jgi:hypothetical protein
MKHNESDDDNGWTLVSSGKRPSQRSSISSTDNNNAKPWFFDHKNRNDDSRFGKSFNHNNNQRNSNSGLTKHHNQPEVFNSHRYNRYAKTRYNHNHNYNDNHIKYNRSKNGEYFTSSDTIQSDQSDKILGTMDHDDKWSEDNLKNQCELFEQSNIQSNDHLSDDHLSDDHLSDDHLSDDHLSDDHLSDDHLSDDNLSDDHLSNDQHNSNERSNEQISNKHNNPQTDYRYNKQYDRYGVQSDILMDRSFKNYHYRTAMNHQDPERNQKQDNYKKILCKNITSSGKCIYGNKCLYAHSLDDQNVEPIRVLAYSMVKDDNDLSSIDLSKKKHLYSHLQSFSKLCQFCEEGKCTGGYNCKHGVCKKEYIICLIDLNKGTCDGSCGYIHLTDKGLVPYGVNVVRNLRTKTTVPRGTIINDEFFNKLNKNIVTKNKLNDDSNNDSDDESNDGLDNDLNDVSNNDLNDNLNDISKDDTNIYTCTDTGEESWIETNMDDLKKDLNVIRNSINDDCSIGSDDSDNIFCGFPMIDDVDDSDTDLYDLRFEDVSKREEKLTKSIFKIDKNLLN